MLKFYYNKSSAFTRWAIDKMEEMVIAHKIIEVHEDSECPKGINRNDLPILCDDHDLWKSESEIRTFLNELHQKLEVGRGMQSDACHINPENPEECL